MAAGYDGSIKIDTSIDPRGFNNGTKQLTGGFSAITAATKKVGVALSGIFVNQAGGYTGVAKVLIGMATGLGAVTRGIGAIASGFRNALPSVISFGKGLLKAFSVSALVLFGASLMAIVDMVRNSMGTLFEKAGLTPQIDDIKNQFEELKLAVANAFLPLIIAALPYIKIAIAWLTEMMNKVAMITAAFMGQKSVLQIVAGSASALAKNTEKAKKSAQGALAAFDQINVLQTPDNSATAATTPAVEMKTVPIFDDILSKVQSIKNEIAAWWNDPWGKIQELYGKLAEWFKTNVTDPIVNWWNTSWIKINIVDPIVQWFKDGWNTISVLAQDAWNRIVVAFTPLANWFMQNIVIPIMNSFDLLKKAVSDCIQSITNAPWWPGLVSTVNLYLSNMKAIFSTIFQTIWNLINNWLKTWVEGFKSNFQFIVDILKAVSATFVGIIAGWITTFAGVMKFITGVFTGDWKLAWSGLGNIVKGIFDQVAAIVKGDINLIVGFLNWMLRGLYTGLSSVIGAINSISISIPDWVPGFGGQSFSPSIPNIGSAPQIPYLATGAVIPPNAQFLAMLGDQKSGRNIEAPEGLIRQIVSEEVGRIQANVTIGFSGSLAALVRELKPYIDKENVRVGGSLVRGSATI